jgi:alkanesulfonate monooxygenase SsuD/methylene tetrahydromethanopterin reductase-like flavin-dependent oxidoreductase (luciferase family)
MMLLGLFDNHQVDPLDPAVASESYRQHLDDLTYADDLGFCCAFTAERHFMPTYQAPAPTAWIAAASQRTRQMRLGVMAYTLPLHAPFRLAEEVAVLDQLSGGRLEVGVGLGHRVEELQAVGVDPADRITIFQERMALLRALWTGGQVTFQGTGCLLQEAAIHPLPLQEPHPPLWFAGTNPAATGWAAAQGMGLAIGFAPAAALQPAVAAFAAARPVEGGGSIALMRHVYVAETDRAAHDEMTGDLLRLAELRDGASGGPGGRADRRVEAAERAAALVRDEIVVAGGPATVAATIQAAEQTLGVDLLLANPYLSGLGPERVRRTLRLLAIEVAPRLAVDAPALIPG